ncbi:aminotransferase class V-fold PLP-dependent enzyme [Actinorhabdospora filicis]|nr:aminotransferase class V-fold PLP-dependent enzyme [Actinorhabdospora filicis]
MTFEEARALFTPETVYLNSATYGLAPRTASEALAAHENERRGGRFSVPPVDALVAGCRENFARLIGVPADQVAMGSHASPLIGLVAASLPDDAVVLAAEEEFNSLLFPFLVARARGVTVRVVPLERLADSLTGDVTMVAVSAAQSSDGRVAPFAALAEARARFGTRILVDATQAAGWLPLPVGDLDYVIAAGYKWLLAPRGTAYLWGTPEALARVTPTQSGWYAGDDPWQSLYGPPLRLAPDARRFDLSPIWPAIIGGAPALDLLAALGVDRIHAHNLGLANAFREGLGLAASDSAIVSVPVAEDVPGRLREAGVVAVQRDGRMRFSFHLYNTESDVETALKAVRG